MLNDQATSSITLGELLYGARRLRERAARAYGALRAQLERAGTPIGDADMRIASIALEHDLVVVTGNVRHFGRVPDLRAENWLG